ncbi:MULTISPECIES: glycoside hydrolase family 13 protein [unclassified Streptomyces]|uniref:glycoside hydrolase family 13 protein n=1 Tax=unclassified Streptomyces TaxID=2593676 RepID=UPI002E17918E|nr:MULTISPECIES: glycoside hydrolase family 13 protein [unclassified Streptomyces]
MVVDDWWRSAAIYQVYVRSFADGDGDGTGDLAGVRARLPYLAGLGVDAIWFTPWYRSPLADGGYDVADYRAIDPAFGTLAEAEKLIAEARDLGIRVIVDIVPNHVSDQHPWFQAALAAGPGSPERELFHFRAGRGAHGELPPNNWPSQFSGATWTRVPDGEWYLHLFTPEQPDLNWAHPAVRQEHEDVLRFWFERGAAGVRVDSAALLAKDPALADASGDDTSGYVDRDELHAVYRSWRAVADSYDGVLIGELWVPDPERFARYLRPDELHTAFNFDFLARPWDAAELRASIDATLAFHAPVGAPATWVLCNHDVTRTVTRYGRADTRFDFATKRFGTPADLDLGLRRARAAALLSLALPGSIYLYQGEELGLPEVEVDRAHIQDPMHARSGGVDPGRDGCRVPLPWTGHGATYGFGDPDSREVWLPQPPDWGTYAAERQEGDPRSMLSLYRSALRLRACQPGFRGDELTWLGAPEGVLAFARGHGLVCVVNLGTEPARLPAHQEVLLTSDALDGDGRLPGDTAAWLRT